MAFPTVAVEVAFTTAPGATPTWTDISSYLERITVKRGRSQETEKYQAGQLTVVLANEDRRFDPTHTTGPYYPNVVPMRRVRVRATYNAVTYDVFNGYVDGWDQTYDHPAVARCALTATDAFKVLAAIELPPSVWAAEVRADTPVAWWRFADPAGSTAALDSINGVAAAQFAAPGYSVGSTFGGAPLLSRDPTDGSVTLGPAGQINGLQAPATAALSGNAFTIEALVRPTTIAAGSNQTLFSQARLDSRDVIHLYKDTADNVRLDVVNDAGTLTAAKSSSTITNNVTYHIVATYSAGTVKIYINGVDVSVNVFTNNVSITGGQPVQIGFNDKGYGANWVGVLDELVLYTTALSSGRAAAHAAVVATPWNNETSGARVGRILDAAGWPAADRQIDTGDAVLQSADLGGTALAALQKIEETEQGRLFVTRDGKVRFISRGSLIQAPYTTSQGTFGDSGVELEYADLKYRYDDQTVVNEVTVSRLEGAAQTVRDTASQAKYLRRSKVIDGLLHASDQTSLDLANWVLNHYSEALLRATNVTLEPDAGNDTTHFPQVLGRELADRVTVRRRPQSVGAAIDQDANIESIGHRVESGLTWKTDWNVSPAETQPYGVWAAATALWDTARWGF